MQWTPAVDWRLVAWGRIVLAAAGLAVVYLVPSEPARLVEETYTALVLHVLYAILIFLCLKYRTRLAFLADRFAHITDVAWYTLLISLSSGTNSIFFYGYVFAIIVASFRWGLRSGMRMTVVCTICFSVFGYLAAPIQEEEEEVQRFLMRPVILVVLGTIVATRGGLEARLRERLQFLKDVGDVANPRFGLDRSIGIVLKRLADRYDADACVLVVKQATGGGGVLRRIRRDDVAGSARAEGIPAEVAGTFLSLPETASVAFIAPHRLQAWPHQPIELDHAMDIAAVLDAGSFVSVPFGFHHLPSGRLFVTFAGKKRFDAAEAAFISQVVDHVFPLIENIRLVDQLAAKAASEERRKIARDIHDSVIQPYIGLRMGLAALRQSLAAKGQDPGPEMDRLVHMTDSGIEDLRGQVSDLKGDAAGRGRLLSAVAGFATVFSEATGIAVEVDAPEKVAIDDRVAVEVFQMVAEGLSNIRRHTSSTWARIVVTAGNGNLALTIRNGSKAVEKIRPFTPGTIEERAVALGGRVDVVTHDDGGTSVQVSVPLWPGEIARS